MIVLSKTQARAVEKLKNWFFYETSEQQIFRLFGFAGTGKTTIIKHIMEELELGSGEIAFGAFTGIAANVMRHNGLAGATTIHSMIYFVRESTIEEIEVEEMVLEDMRERRRNEEDRTKLREHDAKIKEQQKKIESMKLPHWVFNEDAECGQARLICIDEVSMVNSTEAQNLMSFGVPILVIGDPGQLPPIDGPGYFVKGAEPDVMLRRIHRQAAGNPIIQLSVMAREGQFIPFGKFGKGVRKVEQIHKPQTYLKYDQVICGINKTRLNLNRMMRKQLGFSGPLPQEGEKIMCLTNDHDCGLINGMFVRLKNIRPVGNYWIEADIFDDYDGRQIFPKNGRIYRGHFEDHHKFIRTRINDDWKQRRGYIEMTYGYAITCHKAQGSQWPKVLVIDESRYWRGTQRRQWLYTAITRAEQRLTIVG